MPVFCNNEDRREDGTVKLEYLEYIVEVKRCKSISRAARNLYTTQPTVSIAIQNVEDELGFKIFHRSNTGVELTKEGMELYEKIERVLATIEEMKQISEKQSIKAINLLAVPEVCSSFTIDLVERMSSSLKNVSINIKEMRTNELLSSLFSTGNDIGIGCYTKASEKKILSQLNDHDYKVETIIRDCMVVFLSRKDVDSYRHSLNIKDLSEKTPILFVDNEPMSDVSGVNIHKGKPKYLTFSDKSSIKNAIERNIGYAILPSIMGIDDIFVKTGLISMIPLSDSSTSLTTFLAYPKKILSKEETKLLQEIRKLAGETQKRIDASITVEEDKESLNETPIYY